MQDTSTLSVSCPNPPATHAMRKRVEGRGRRRYRFLDMFPLRFCECFQGHCLGADTTSQLVRLLRRTILTSTHQHTTSNHDFPHPPSQKKDAVVRGEGDLRDLSGIMRNIPVLIDCRQQSQESFGWGGGGTRRRRFQKLGFGVCLNGFHLVAHLALKTIHQIQTPLSSGSNGKEGRGVGG